MKDDLTLDRLKQVLAYDRSTGLFTWKRHPWPSKIGTVAGSILNGQYLCVMIDRRKYLLHRLAWFYENGTWPKDWIDHRDLDGLNNRISNLREANRSQNMANSRRPATNTSGVKGVYRNARGTWTAQVGHRRRVYVLGTFRTIEEASQAYEEGARALFGEFARVA